MRRIIRWVAGILFMLPLGTLSLATSNGRINKVWLFLAALSLGSAVVALTKKVIQLAIVVVIALFLISLPHSFWDGVVGFFTRLLEVMTN